MDDESDMDDLCFEACGSARASLVVGLDELDDIGRARRAENECGPSARLWSCFMSTTWRRAGSSQPAASVVAELMCASRRSSDGPVAASNSDELVTAPEVVVMLRAGIDAFRAPRAGKEPVEAGEIGPK